MQVSIIWKPTYILHEFIPAVKGTLGGLYLPSLYGTDSGIGIVLYCGKSVISSGVGVLFSAEGFKIYGGVKKGSFKWASPSTNMVEIRL